jgi:hypothetical protein
MARDWGLQLLIRSGDQAEAFGQTKQFGGSDLWEALVQHQFAPSNDLASLWPAGACTSTDTMLSPVTTANVLRNIGTSSMMRQTESGLPVVGPQRCGQKVIERGRGKRHMFFQGQHVRHFLRLVIPPQTNNSSNISVFNRWVPVGACPKCSQIADISRSLADHDDNMAAWSMRHRHLARYRRRQFCEFGLQTSHVCSFNFLPPRTIFCQSEFAIFE